MRQVLKHIDKVNVDLISNQSINKSNDKFHRIYQTITSDILIIVLEI